MNDTATPRQVPDTYKQHTFLCPRRTIEEVQFVGVQLRKPSGRPHYYTDDDGGMWKELGAVYVLDSGRIIVWPYEGLSQRELNTLTGAGEEAFRNPPSKKTGWTFCRRASKKWWRTYLALRVDNDHDAASSVARAHEDFETFQHNVLDSQIREVA